MRISSYWDFPKVQNWEKRKQTKTFCHIIVFLDYCDSNMLEGGMPRGVKGCGGGTDEGQDAQDASLI